MNRIAFLLCVCFIFIFLPPLPVSAEGEVPEFTPTPEPTEFPEPDLENQDVMLLDERIQVITPNPYTPLSSSAESARLAIIDPWYACFHDTVDGVDDGICQYSSIQAAVDDFIDRGGYGIIMIEPGNFSENVTINNITQLSGLEGISPFSPAQISGSLTIQTKIGFSLSNLNILGGILISSSNGNLAINNVNVTNSAGHGVEIIDHAGDVSLDTVNLSNNSGYGLRIRTTSGSISIRNSILNHNLTGASLLSPEYIAIDLSTFNTNSQIGLEILNASSAFINSSDFSSNRGTGVAGAGILASGPVTINNVTANQNTGDGIILFTSQGDILIMNSSFNNNGMYGLRAFWPEYYTFTAERVNACYNRIGSYWLFGSEREGRIETCNDSSDLTGASLNDVLLVRTIILDSINPSGTFLTDLPTQVLVKDDQAAPPVTLARLFFPLSSNPLIEISVTSIEEDDPLVVPALETAWLSPGIKVSITTPEDAALLPEITFSVCFTSSSAGQLIVFLGDGMENWKGLDSLTEGNQVCAFNNQPGIFVLADSLP